MVGKDKTKVGILYNYALTYADKPVEFSRLCTIDMTDEFFKDIELQIINNKQLNIEIRGTPRYGKSTIAIHLGKHVFGLLKKHNKRKGGRFGIGNIVRDQQEYSKVMRDPKTTQTVIVTDEYNEMEETGENSSVEQKFGNTLSDVHAGRYVHRISCSPRHKVDPNSTISLQVISNNRNDMTTHCHLYYNFQKGQENFEIMLGVVNFNVKDLILDWSKTVEPIFLRGNKLKKDSELISKWRKKDFYVEYMYRKYLKMELLTKYNITRPRMLDYANVILIVERKLRNLAKLNILDKNTISNYIKIVAKKEKIITSIIGEELMTREVDGILKLWKNVYKNNIMLDKATKIKDFGRVKILKKVNNEIEYIIKEQINELDKCLKLNKEYNKILSLNK